MLVGSTAIIFSIAITDYFYFLEAISTFKNNVHREWHWYFQQIIVLFFMTPFSYVHVINVKNRTEIEISFAELISRKDLK